MISQEIVNWNCTSSFTDFLQCFANSWLVNLLRTTEQFRMNKGADMLGVLDRNEFFRCSCEIDGGGGVCDILVVFCSVKSFITISHAVYEVGALLVRPNKKPFFLISCKNVRVTSITDSSGTPIESCSDGTLLKRIKTKCLTECLTRNLTFRISFRFIEVNTIFTMSQFSCVE